MTQTLSHVVGGCISSLREGRRHDSIIVNMAKFLTALKNVQVFADVDQYMSPSIITGEDLRLDLVVVHQRTDICVSEYTAGFESNIQKNAARKYKTRETSLEERKLSYDEVTFINLSVGACGEKKQSDYLMTKLCNICLLCTCSIFCKRDQLWQSTELLQW